MIEPLDLDALNIILKTMNNTEISDDPGGEIEWLEALSAWAIDESERLDAATMAKKLVTIWEVGNLVEKELQQAKFQCRATMSVQFPYRGADGELKGGIVETHRLHVMNDAPRELACAIAAEVQKNAKDGQNVVMFRRLIVKSMAWPKVIVYESSFGLARIA